MSRLRVDTIGQCSFRDRLARSDRAVPGVEFIRAMKALAGLRGKRLLALSGPAPIHKPPDGRPANGPGPPGDGSRATPATLGPPRSTRHPLGTLPPGIAEPQLGLLGSPSPSSAPWDRRAPARPSWECRAPARHPTRPPTTPFPQPRSRSHATTPAPNPPPPAAAPQFRQELTLFVTF